MKVVVVGRELARLPGVMPEFLRSEEEDNDDVDESLGVSGMKQYDVLGGVGNVHNRNRRIRGKKS